MSTNSRAALGEVLVGLTRALVHDYDVLELLDRLLHESIAAVGSDGAALAVLDQRGSVQVLAATSETARHLDLFQVMADEGPCIDSIHTGQPASGSSAVETAGRWPRYAAAARAIGVRATDSLPLRLRGSTLGSLNLFRTTEGALSAEQVEVAQAFADGSTLAIVHHRMTTNWGTVAGYLQDALNQRITIEVAKGVLKEVAGVDAAQAAAMLLVYSRESGQRLGDLAAGVVAGGDARDAVVRSATSG